MRNILIVGLILSAISSCGYLIAKPLSNSYVRKNKASLLPENFFSENHTLVIILDKSNTSYNRKVQKTVSRLYAGDTEFMTLSEYDSKDSSEVLRYSFRYIPPSTYSVHQNASSPGGSNQTIVKGRVFYMYDRETGKRYRCGIHTSFYMRIVEAYFKRLDKWRLEN